MTNKRLESLDALPRFELPADFVAELPAWLEKYKDVIDEGRCDKNGNRWSTFVNINETGKGDHVGKNMPLRPGDVVRVPVK